MAFNNARFVRQTVAFNAGQITTKNNPATADVLSNGPAWFTYASADDDLATVAAANYFADEVLNLSVNDRIDVTASDASGMYIVSAVDEDAGTISLGSYSASGVVGTANIQDGAVTTAKLAADAVDNTKLADDAVQVENIADGAVESDKLDANLVQYAQVAVTAAEFNGMYATPKELVAAAGANTLLVLDRVILAMTYGSAAFANGGNAAVQYDDTANGAGVIASTVLAAASFQDTASTSYSFNAGVVEYPFSTSVNTGLYLSNITGAFDTGDSDFVAHVWYKVIPTV